MDHKTNFKSIISENEQAVQIALNRSEYLLEFLLIHTLIESLLRTFFGKEKDNIRFKDLVNMYEDFLKSNNYMSMTFVKELIELNHRHNRAIHQLWKKGYIWTNEEIKDAAISAIVVYSLFIEFLEKYDDNLKDSGFLIEE